MKIIITERGWAGHFICSRYCSFRRNTLVESDNIHIVISTVGIMKIPPNDVIEKINLDTYYETMIFYAKFDGLYWDTDVERTISEDRFIKKLTDSSDLEANQRHEQSVQDIVFKIRSNTPINFY